MGDMKVGDAGDANRFLPWTGLSPVENMLPLAPPSACDNISFMRTIWYFFLVDISGCANIGCGFDRVRPAMTASFSSSESIGPFPSTSS